MITMNKEEAEIMNDSKNPARGQRRITFYFLLVTLLCSMSSSTGQAAAEDKKEIEDRKSRGRAHAVFFAGNTYYDEGNFQAACKSYEELVEQGLESGNLYFNLGNTYYKLGKKGLAVLYYEKARKIMPQDADLKANLSFVTESIEEGEIPGLTRFYHFLIHLASLERLFICTAVTFSLFLLLLIISSLIQAKEEEGDWPLLVWRNTRPVLLGLAVVFIFLSSLTILTYNHYHHQRPGVAIYAGGGVRYEPVQDGTLYFHLAEGSRLQILEEKGEWYLIKRVDGKRGWVKKEYIGAL
jgi:tetratricopeptide (TPR) repeat protein